MSNEGGFSFFRWIGHGIWFFVRLIILLITDHWIPAKGDKEADPKPTPATFTPRTSQTIRPGTAGARDVLTSADRLVQGAERARGIARSVSSGDGIAQWLDEAMITPLRRTRERAGAGDTRALLQLARMLPAHEASLSFVMRSLDARRSAAQAQIVADVEEVASALAEPLRELDGDAMARIRRRRFIVAPIFSKAELDAARDGGLVVPIALTPELMSDPRRWVWLAREVARALLDDVSGWLTELRAGLPLRVPAAALTDRADPRLGQRLLGPWLPELMSDALATFMLGPSYATELSDELARAQDVERASTAEVEGAWLSSTPPARLRIHAALSVLEELGFQAEAAALRTRHEIARAQAPLKVRRADGTQKVVPFAAVTEPLDTLLSFAMQEPNTTLGQRAWLDLDGLGFLQADEDEVRRAKPQLLRGQKVTMPTRVLVAAAAQALQERNATKATVLAGLLRSIRGIDVSDLAASAVKPGPVRRPRARLHELVTDPRAIREAVVLGAIFSRPRGMNGALSKP
jgi:hypothetical protein